jgi:hypothetical protein
VFVVINYYLSYNKLEKYDFNKTFVIDNFIEHVSCFVQMVQNLLEGTETHGDTTSLSFLNK